MSNETISGATIEVGVDSSAAEAGLGRIDSSTARTGLNLENLGRRGAEGLNRVSSGADNASSRMDAATRNIAGAVERATAALIAGKKSSSEYFEELARSRGADLARLAPLIAQLRETEAAQARARAAMDATAASQAAAAEAARNQAAALREAAQAQATRDNFLNGLREQVQLYGKSAEEALRYRAAQIGVAESAGPLIAQLQTLRAAHEAVAEASRQEALAQRQAAQTQSSREAFLAGLREQIALQGKNTEETLRYRAAQLGISSAAESLVAQLASVKAAQDAVTASARATAEAQRQASQAQAGRDSFVASLQQQAAAIGKTRVELLELQAAQMGVASQAAPFIQRLREAEQGLNNTGMSARATAAAMRGVPAQFTDIFVSLQGGQAPLTVLLQQGGQLKDMFGGAGAAAKALGGYVLSLINPFTIAAAAAVALGVAYYQGAAEAKAFNMAITMTGNAVGVTAGQLSDMAKAASQVAGTQGKNAEVLALLVGTGKVAADQLVAASITATRAQKFLGIEVEETVKAYAELGAEPLRASLKLNEQHNYLTLSVYKQIKALEIQGRVIDAAKVAQVAYDDAMAESTKKVEAQLGLLRRAWNATATFAKNAWDSMLDIGREDSLDDKLKKAEERVRRAQQAFFRFAGSDAQKQQDLDAAKRERDALKAQKDSAAAAAEEEGAKKRRNKAAIEFDQESDKYLSRREQMLKEIARVTGIANQGRPLPGTDEQSRKAAADYEEKLQNTIAGIRGRYADVNNASIASQIGAVERLGAVQEEVAKRARILLESQQQAGGSTALDKRIEYAEAVAKLDEEGLRREQSRAQQRLAITAGETVSEDQRAAHQEKMASLRGQAAAVDEKILTRRAQLSKDVAALEIEANRAAFGSLEKLLESRQSEADALQRQVQAQFDANAVIGLSKEKAAEYGRTLIEEVATRKEIEASILDTIIGREDEAEALRRSAAAMRALGDAQRDGALKTEQFEDAKKSAEELAKFLDPARAQDFGSALRDAFGGAGSALVKLTTSLQSFAKKQSEFDKQRDAAEDKRKNGLGSEADYIRDITTLNKMQTSERLRGYGDMAGAAAGFFGEQSKGYKALTTMSQVFHAAELAMTLAELVPKGISAVLSQGQGDPYTAFGRMAAMAAIVAGLGVAIGGSGGSGKSVSQQRQETQGTGTVFGDSKAKSDSIKRSMDLVASNSSIELSYTQGMLSSLRNIESSMAGLGNLLVRNSGLTGEMASGSQGSAAKFLTSTAGTVLLTGMFAPLVMTADKLLGGTISKWTASISNKIFGGKVTTEDTGFTINPASLGSAMSGNINSYQYTDIKKSGGLLRSSKRDTIRSELGDEADAQFAKVIIGLGSSVTEAAKLLGVGGDEFTQRLNSFVIDIGKVSLKGLSGEEIQKELEAVFSKVGDNMAKFGVSGLGQFQQVGEGYFETLTRIAMNYSNLDSILAASGTTFGQTGLASIAARERLIAMAGGIDELASKSTSFGDNFLTQAERLAPVQKYVTDQLAAMGLQSLDTRDKFKEYTLGLANSGALLVSGDITTRSQEQYVALLALSDAFAKTHAAAVDLTKSEQEIADERTDLQNQLDQLTMTQAQLAEKARAAIDAHNLALYDQVVAAQAAKDAADAAAEAAETLASTNAGYQQQIDALLAARQGEAAVRALEIAGMDASTVSLYDRLKALQKEDEAIKAAAEAQANAAKALVDAVSRAYSNLQSSIGREKDALSASFKTTSDGIKAGIDRITGAVGKLKGLSDALHSTLDSMSVVDGLDSRRSAQAQVEAALAIARAGGPLPEAEALKKALSTLSQDASDQYASYVDYQRDQYQTQRSLSALAGITDTQLSIEERALEVLQQQQELAQATYDAEVQRLDGLLEHAKTQVDLLGGIASSQLTLLQSLAAMAKAVGAAQANPTVGADALTGMYRDLLGRTPDADGFKFWQNALAGGTSLESIRADFLRSEEYQKLHAIPGFAAGGLHMGGLRIVGENGPELEATGPSRIFNATQTASMLRGGGDNSELLAELREQRRENAELRQVLESHLYAIAKSNRNIEDFLDGAVNGDTPIATRDVEVVE